MKRLYLSKDKKLAGVCGGIGEYYNVDPSLVRLIWIVISVLTGIVPGAIAYFTVALVVPRPPATKGSEG